MVVDLWHYPRTALAEQVLGMFETSLSSTLVFFAPRRMGKTEFLCKDMMPLAEKRNWKVFYFSFLDAGSAAATEFTKALATFAETTGVLGKGRGLLQKISKVNAEAAGVKAGLEFNQHQPMNENMKEILARLAAKTRVLLLMDEVQILAQESINSTFIAAFRTVLDIHKDTIKVIFTGSSQEGLRRMFSQAKAPFFHFGQNLPFPELDRGFTDHLAQTFKLVTKRQLDKEALWNIFQEMQRIPQLARAFVERLALHPNLTLEEAKNQLLTDVFTARAFADNWDQCSALEQLVLCEIASGTIAFFSGEVRNRLAKMLGIQELPPHSLQSTLRVLQRKGLIGKQVERSGYFIEDPNFKNWLLQKCG